MMRKIIVVVILLISIKGVAQKSNASAYSFFGIGDKNNASTVEQLSMGGVGVAFSDIYHLNLSNPASLASLQFTSFSLAVENKNIWANDGGDTQSGASSYLSYMALGVPLGEKGGLNFGLIPNTSVGYSLVSNEFSGDDLSEITSYDGKGGTNKVFFGVGYELFNGFNVGLQGNYVFGKVENSIINQIKNSSLGTKYESTSSLEGFSMNVGFQYKTEVKENVNLYVGASFDLENELESEGEENLYSVSFLSGEVPKDTILSNTNTGIIRAPLKSTIGFGFGQNDKWFAGAEYSYQKALDIEGGVFSNNSKIVYDEFSKFAIGGFYTPKFNSITSYWERVTYRAGLKMEKTGLLIDGIGDGNNFKGINDFGISFGVGLPVSNQLSSLNIGFEVGKRGEASNGLVKENYVNFRLSLSLTDKWFKKLEIF